MRFTILMILLALVEVVAFTFLRTNFLKCKIVSRRLDFRQNHIGVASDDSFLKFINSDRQRVLQVFPTIDIDSAELRDAAKNFTTEFSRYIFLRNFLEGRLLQMIEPAGG